MSSARRYLKVFESVAKARAIAKTAKSAESGQQCSQISPAQWLASVLEALESRCPEHVDHADWQQAVEDGRRFLATWGKEATALGWTARDLFGLAAVPNKPAASYRRQSRYDETGLVWLLRGRTVLALTETTAAIENPAGVVTIYYRHNKPAPGPVCDSLHG